MTSDPSWKDKYLQELETSEQREKQWETEKNSLERLLVRTSLASEGQDPDLDQLLSRLRTELRKDRLDSSGWGKLQEQIDQQLALLDRQNDTSARQLANRFNGLLSAVRSHPLFVERKRSIRELEKSLRKSTESHYLLTNWMSELATLLERTLSESREGQPVAASGMFNRLFGGRGRTEQRLESDASSTGLAPEAASAMPPMDLGGEKAEAGEQRLRIARRVGELLDHMLSQVSLDPIADARARRLQQSLLTSDDWNELREGLNGVADLIIVAVTHSQREFEGFLKRLDDRLGSLRQHFMEQSSAQAGRLDASETLDREIRRELDAVGHRVASSTDLRELQQSVSHHLSSIADSVGRYRSRESEREKNLSHQLEAMQEKLAAVEAHSEQMQEKLQEERKRALTDILTQLPNREAWQERLSFEYSRWQRYQHPLTIGVLDIDFFKKVNDSYGHKAGDRVLQLVAKALQDRLRNTDFIARYGGEEFVILLPETAPETARAVLDNVRQHVASLPFHFRGEPVSVTFSAGLAGFAPGVTEEQVFDEADRALYVAKDSGRNQVRIAGQ